jgi:MFS family permease
MFLLQAAASSFAVGAAAWPWGIFSDRIGRKIVILVGNCSTAACIVMFSLSGRYWEALLFRFLAGILDGSLV